MEDQSFATLTSSRLVIRRFASDDAEALASYRNDPAVARYQGWDCPYLPADARAFINSLDGLVPGTPGTWFQFAVSLASSGALIGDAALRTIEGDGEAEIGFTFATRYQGHGYATEAVRVVVQYGFDTLKMHRVFALTDARNLRAQRLLERLKFRREGELRERIWFKGAWATDLVYAARASEWRCETDPSGSRPAEAASRRSRPGRIP